MDRPAHALGRPLAAIAGVWLLARLAAPLSLSAAALLDALFALGVAWGIGRPILGTRNRNWHFIVFVLALGAASAAFATWPRIALAVGLDVVLLVVAIMAGRVIPAFTNNAVTGAGARRNRWIEYGSLGSVIALIFLDLVSGRWWLPCFASARMRSPSG